MENLLSGSNTLFVLLGAIMVLAMHSGFAFLEAGTVRHKNQVNALVKILCDFSISTIAYFFIGYTIAYSPDLFTGIKCFVSSNLSTEIRNFLELGYCDDDYISYSTYFAHFFSGALELSRDNGYGLVKFFFLLTFAAAVPAIISGGIAERARFYPQLIASFIVVALIYPFFEGIAWNGNYGIQDWILANFGAKFNDFAGSVVVHAVGGWLAFGAVILLGARKGRYTKTGAMNAFAPSSIPFLALGAWVLSVGWFGFNVMSAQTIDTISGLVAVNSLMAMIGGTLAALLAGRNDPGFVHNGPLAGLVAVCAGSNVMHPIGALVTGIVAGVLFVIAFDVTQRRWKIDDVLGVWPLHGLCGTWGGIAAGIFGLEKFGGIGGVTFSAQLVGTLIGVLIALVGGFLVYGVIKVVAGIRLSAEQEFEGADLSTHKISANPKFND